MVPTLLLLISAETEMSAHCRSESVFINREIEGTSAEDSSFLKSVVTLSLLQANAEGRLTEQREQLTVEEGQLWGQDGGSKLSVIGCLSLFLAKSQSLQLQI